jgi:hypothetical protein
MEWLCDHPQAPVYHLLLLLRLVPYIAKHGQNLRACLGGPICEDDPSWEAVVGFDPDAQAKVFLQMGEGRTDPHLADCLSVQ